MRTFSPSGSSVSAVRLLGALISVALASALTVPAVAQGDSPGARTAMCPGGVLSTHAPINITNDAGFTAANGVTSGSGTAADPYVISCWSIAAPIGVGIKLPQTTQAVVVRDVELVPSGAPRTGTGLEIRTNGGVAMNVTLEHLTATSLSTGIFTSGVEGSLLFASNLLQGNLVGYLDNGSNVAITGNTGAGNTTCILRNISTTAEEHPVVTDNTCSGGGTGIDVDGTTAHGSTPLEARGNLAEDNTGAGFRVGGTTHLAENVSRRNSTGIGFSSGTHVVEDNLTEENTQYGIDLAGTGLSVLRNNTIRGNGSAGIIGAAFITGNPFSAGSSNFIVGNYIGTNPFGIVLLYENIANVVRDTDWIDGHPAFIRFSDENTIVDAGSAYRGVMGEGVFFHDYVATVNRVPGGTLNTQQATITTAQWDFGDGTTMAIPVDALQGHATPPDVHHTYAATGTYTATLTVNAVDESMQPLTFTDTTTVTIIEPSPAAALLPQTEEHSPWPDLGNGPHRSFFNAQEEIITPATANQLVLKWRFPTVEPVTASPSVAIIDVGGIPTKVAFAGTFSGAMHAIRTASGVPLWGKCLIPGDDPFPVCDVAFPNNPDRQTAYGAIVDAPALGTVALPGGLSEQRVFIGVTGTTADLVAMDAATGDERWRFVAASNAPTYSIGGSPVLVGSTLYFAMDCNNRCDKSPGVFAIDAVDGHLIWFFDVQAGTAYQPAGFTLAFDPTTPIQRDCSGVWSSPAVDAELGLVIVGTGDCTAVPMPLYNEAVFALNMTTGDPVWRFRPREIDKRDQDFGATPNLFRLGDQHVVGAGGKDGVYYALDAATGQEIWSTKLALGGNFGGFYGTVVDGEKIYLTNAIGEATDIQSATDERKSQGINFALDARSGNVLWRNFLGPGSVGQNSGVRGLYLTGGLDHQIHLHDSATGALLHTLSLSGASSSVPTVAGGEVFAGAGTGATYRAAVGDSDPLGVSGITFPHPIPITEYGQGIYAFCVATDLTCAAERATIVALLPEPRVLAALAAGVLALVGLGVLRARRRRPGGGR